IVFPAAQLLPPYFEASADDAVNYGAIGAVIGHEMLHAFDDEGSKFDARGNLADWWSADDRRNFEERTAVLVGQFAPYVPIDSSHINGQLTLGENIADLGGLLVAYDAFKTTAQGRGEEPIDGLTPDQRFFLAYAQSWRETQRPEQLKRQLLTNEHAPARYRVDGPVSNSSAFAAAFGCKTRDAMVRGAAQVKIWEGEGKRLIVLRSFATDSKPAALRANPGRAARERPHPVKTGIRLDLVPSRPEQDGCPRSGGTDSFAQSL